MDTKTGIIIVLGLSVFIAIRVHFALNYDSSESQGDQNEFPADLPAVYTGTIPCASCPGIDIHLLLRENHFRKVSWYIDREDGPFTQTGSWEVSGDTLTTMTGNNSTGDKYLVTDSKLALLGMNDQRVTGDLDDRYILRYSDMEHKIRERYRELRDRGVRFIASGNEPFWSIRHLENDSLLYITPQSEVSGRITGRTESADSLVIESRLVGDQNDQMMITIRKEYCRDTMSGFLFTHSVSITSGSDILAGCGRYLDQNESDL